MEEEKKEHWTKRETPDARERRIANIQGARKGHMKRAPATLEGLRELQKDSAPGAYVRMLRLSRSDAVKKKKPDLYFEANRYVYECNQGKPKMASGDAGARPIQFTFRLVDKKSRKKDEVAIEVNEGEDVNGETPDSGASNTPIPEETTG